MAVVFSSTGARAYMENGSNLPLPDEGVPLKKIYFVDVVLNFEGCEVLLLCPIRQVVDDKNIFLAEVIQSVNEVASNEASPASNNDHVFS